MSYVAIRQIQCYRQFRILSVEKPLRTVFDSVAPYPVLVAARLKRLPSIKRKLTREETINLSQMADIIGIRVVTETVSHSNEVVKALKQAEGFHREYDYVARPRDTGYRGRHLILRVAHDFPSGGNRASFDVEVQVRTFFQHTWALTSERFGEKVKAGAGAPEIHRYLASLSGVIAKWESENTHSQQRPLGITTDVPRVAVVRVPRQGRPLPQFFEEDYGKAARQLIAWEEDLSGGDSESLLLVSKGSVNALNVTHAVFLGLQEVPLADWMPSYDHDNESAA